MSHSLLIISHDVVGEAMAGPGIRYYHLANVMAKHLPTTLAVPQGSTIAPDSQQFRVFPYERNRWESILPAIRDHTICLLPSDLAKNFIFSTDNPYLIIDGYDPLLIEWLSVSSRRPLDRQMADWHVRLDQLTDQFRVGDFFVCASERQRDWWLGMLEAHGRINPATFKDDVSLRKLIDVLPYGVRSDSLPRPKAVIKGVWPGISKDDQLIVWGGGLWTWLDPLTAIRAVATLTQTHPTLRLVFPGTKHPNPEHDGLPTLTNLAKELAQQLGLLDRFVFFGDWIAYADWPHVLQESSIALSLHHDTVETRLAFRSRMLEYIWAGLPIIATRGDATSEIVIKHNLGIVVNYQSVDAVSVAIQQLLNEDDKTHRDFSAARSALAWERCAQPLVRYSENPWYASDKEMIQIARLTEAKRLAEIEANQKRAKQLEQAQQAAQIVQANQQATVEEAQKVISALHQERDRWRTLAEGYANGRVMRLLNWVNRLFRTV